METKTRKFTETEVAILRRNRLSNMDIMVGARTILKKNNITTIGKLLQYSEKEIRGLRGYGGSKMSNTVFEDLKENLEKIGLHLRE